MTRLVLAVLLVSAGCSTKPEPTYAVTIETDSTSAVSVVGATLDESDSYAFGPRGSVVVDRASLAVTVYDDAGSERLKVYGAGTKGVVVVNRGATELSEIGAPQPSFRFAWPQP